MGRPIIGITGELEAARWGNWIREAVVSPVSYTRAVDRAGDAGHLAAGARDFRARADRRTQRPAADRRP
jgi:hypothetical protein